MGSESPGKLKRWLLFIDDLLTGVYLWLSMALALSLALLLFYALFGR